MPFRPSKPSDADADALSTIQKAYTHHDYSDLCLIAGREYSLHCVLVCTRSEFLKTAVRWNTEVSTRHCDSPKATLDLTGYDQWAVDCMVQYLYLQDYSTTPDTEDGKLDPLSPWPHRMVVHARVFALAEQCGIPSLKKTALQKFSDEVENGWRLPAFAHAAHEVYTSTTDDIIELRHVVVQTLYYHSHELKSRDDIKAVFLENPQLGFDYYTRC
ncbi:hypothetical protein PWT90_06455 [Aphanocladium album]|nr:hypothetical protein PWT90_06455 [Aphanocladium album]